MIKYPKGALKTTAEIAALVAEGKSVYLAELGTQSPIKLVFDPEKPIIEMCLQPSRHFLNYKSNGSGHYFLWALGLDDEKAPDVFYAPNFQPEEFVFANYWDAFAYACKAKKVA